MKKKTLKISIILTIFFLVVAVVFFFLMKNAESDMNLDESKGDDELYDVSQIVRDINFLKLNTFEEIEKYANEYPIYIQSSDDKTLFAIGELYIKDLPVSLFYKLNDDGSINRFDGSYSYELPESTKDEVWNVISYFNHIIDEYFYFTYFDYDVYDEDGAPIDPYSETSYELILNGKAKYNLSVIDEHGTYWNISASVKDGKKMEFEFFRCFDLSIYDDDSPNIDLRPVVDETGE